MLGTTALLMLDPQLPGALPRHVICVQDVQDTLITRT